MKEANLGGWAAGLHVQGPGFHTLHWAKKKSFDFAYGTVLEPWGKAVILCLSSRAAGSVRGTAEEWRAPL